jgi:hypothetical protein
MGGVKRKMTLPHFGEAVILLLTIQPAFAESLAGKEYDPSNDLRWSWAASYEKTNAMPHTLETVEALKRDVREHFIAHLNRASNVEAPRVDSAEFDWKIDWKAQQAYCNNVVDALFKHPERLSFPQKPDATLLRDGPEKVLKVLNKAFNKCEVPQVKTKGGIVGGRMSEIEASRAQLSQTLDKHPDRFWNVEYYVADNFWISVAHSSKPAPGLRGDSEIGYSAGDPCPSKRYTTQLQYSVERYWSLDMRTVLGLIDGQPAVFMFGIYGRVHLQSGGGWTDVPETSWSEGKRFGQPGQGFVFVDGLNADLYHNWAQSPVEPHILTAGIPARPYDDGRHLLACVINFDLKQAQ